VYSGTSGCRIDFGMTVAGLLQFTKVSSMIKLGALSASGGADA